jgi:hypothetical protein
MGLAAVLRLDATSAEVADGNKRGTGEQLTQRDHLTMLGYLSW